MLLCFYLGCTVIDNAPVPEETLPRSDVRYELHSVRACAVIADDSPTPPDRLVFLVKTDPNQTDSQVELYGFDASRFRCGTMDLHLPVGSDHTDVVVDFMPPFEPVTLREFRVYDLGVAWNPEDPFALARDDHRPFIDYEFGVSLAPPSGDASTLFLRP